MVFFSKLIHDPITNYLQKWTTLWNPTFPPAPPDGWWIIILAFGMQNLFPFVPAANKNAPMEAANPKQTVEISALQNFMAS